jgi:hypothetical protein
MSVMTPGEAAKKLRDIANRLAMEFSENIMPIMRKIRDECETVNPIKELTGQFRTDMQISAEEVEARVYVDHPRSSAIWGLEKGRKFTYVIKPVRVSALKFPPRRYPERVPKTGDKYIFRAWSRLVPSKAKPHFTPVMMKYLPELRKKTLEALRRVFTV